MENCEDQVVAEAFKAREHAKICVLYSLPRRQSWHVSRPSSDFHELIT